MSWLATLDAKAHRWPLAGRGLYHGLKWALVAFGALGAIGLAQVEIHEHRVGLGTGLAVAIVFGVIKGVITAVRRPESPPTPPTDRESLTPPRRPAA